MEYNGYFKKRTILITGIIGLILSSSVLCIQLQKKQNILVFCDVGQGDGAYLRMNNAIDIVIDAGPNKAILDCLGSYMPFYDHTIEIAFLSHPQKDHLYGFFFLSERYKILTLFVSSFHIDTPLYNKLKDKLKEKQISVREIRANDEISFLDSKIHIFWPSREFIVQHLKAQAKDLNEYSLVFTIETNNKKALFTGDAPPSILRRLSQQSKIKADILKVPHHGSKNGLTSELLRLANPRVAVISVGKKNSYGHPSKTILDMLKAQNVVIRRTDQEGDIVIKF